MARGSAALGAVEGRVLVSLTLVLLLFGSAACQKLRDRFEGTGARCMTGLLPLGARCCAPGQRERGGHCTGLPSQCPGGYQASNAGTKGCVLVATRLRVTSTGYFVGPNDWESEHVPLDRGEVKEFWLDRSEVTWDSYFHCIAAGGCQLLTDPKGAFEPGQPITRITGAQAKAFCAWAGGYLPLREQWLAATAGTAGRRFPWGQTGLVCRRAAFGLVAGPCAEGGVSPEWSGARPDGRSPDGVLDLVGNVAELVQCGARTRGARPQATAQECLEVRGGSFRSEHAAALKSWAVESYLGPRDDVGFRCAYDSDANLPEAH